jgi:predicted homoserine dehydrogenase-like protein
VLGAEPDGGVFAIGYCAQEYQRNMLRYYKMGEGPYYVFYRPYHLCHIEAMSSVADAFLFGHSLLEPSCGLRTNVFAYAKRNLVEGHSLDGIGGYTCYGMIENCPPATVPLGLPIALADDVILKRDVERDERILLSDIEYNSDRFDFNLYFKSLKLQGEQTS